MNKDLIEKELKIIDEYGALTQLKYFQSEIFELNEAIIQYEYIDDFRSYNYIDVIDHITEEIADVMVMLKQFQLNYGIDDKDIEKIMSMKINRQIDRIKKERANK